MKRPNPKQPKLTKNDFKYMHISLSLRIEACEDNNELNESKPYRKALKKLEAIWLAQNKK